MAVYLVSMAGPWAYDRIMVPAQFECSAPFVRLEGDFCGLPMSGYHLISLYLGAILQFVLHQQVASEPSALTIRDLIVLAAMLSLLMPAITTILAVCARSKTARQLTISSWSITFLVAAFIALSNWPGVQPSYWGVSLFVGLATAAVIVEAAIPVEDAEEVDVVSA